jgi:hypothetical protein
MPVARNELLVAAIVRVIQFSLKKGMGSLAQAWMDDGLGGLDRCNGFDPPDPPNPSSIQACASEPIPFFSENCMTLTIAATNNSFRATGISRQSFLRGRFTNSWSLVIRHPAPQDIDSCKPKEYPRGE